MSNKDTFDPFSGLHAHFAQLFRGSGFPVPPGGSPEKKPAQDPQAPDPQAEALARIRSFQLRPKEIRDYLNRFVIRQDEAKKVLAVAICDHYNHVRRCVENPSTAELDYSKQNILLLGPTGVGKTYLMRTIARLIGVPFVRADATKFSETGYVGGDVEDIVRDLVRSAGGNVELAQYGIVYIDEIDKIANPSSRGQGGPARDVSGRGVQTNLLKLMEDTTVSLSAGGDIFSQMQVMMDPAGGGKPRQTSISTRHILFIVSGAFDGLAEAIRRRLDRSSIGFAAAPLPSDRSEDPARWLHQAATADFIDYGFEPEFIGRLPVRVACDPLSAEDLVRIVTTSEGSILRQYHEAFRGSGIEFSITEGAIQSIAERAAAEKTGARGLLTVLEKVFRELKFELPSTAIRQFTVDETVVQDPPAALQKLQEENCHLQKAVLWEDLKRFADSFGKEHSLQMEFDEGATELLIESAQKQDLTIRALCQQKFRDFHHGLAIIARNTGQQKFLLTRSTVENPDAELSRWVVESFRTAQATLPEPKAPDQNPPV